MLSSRLTNQGAISLKPKALGDKLSPKFVCFVLEKELMNFCDMATREGETKSRYNNRKSLDSWGGFIVYQVKNAISKSSCLHVNCSMLQNTCCVTRNNKTVLRHALSCIAVLYIFCYKCTVQRTP